MWGVQMYSMARQFTLTKCLSALCAYYNTHGECATSLRTYCVTIRLWWSDTWLREYGARRRQGRRQSNTRQNEWYHLTYGEFWFLFVSSQLFFGSMLAIFIRCVLAGCTTHPPYHFQRKSRDGPICHYIRNTNSQHTFTLIFICFFIIICFSIRMKK